MAPGGYQWWYVDALSDDGLHGLTIIAFVGSVFSPYYAWSRRRGLADPADHCALNVALYGPRAKRWAMTERPRERVRRERDAFIVGPSAVHRDGSVLTIEIDEVTVPIPSRLRGTVRVHPTATTPHAFAIDADGRHRWTPYAPAARVDVQMTAPDLAWRGTGYFDGNAGSTPLEHAFVRWDWSRAALDDDGAAVLYDVTRRDGSEGSLALRFDAHGDVVPFEPPPRAALPRGFWRVGRATRSEAGADRTAAVLQTLEDAPFYARSLVESRLLGARRTSVHESLDLDRFSSRIVQCMLPFRMPRAFRR